jgi:3-oxoadipate enol-lactonase
MPFIESSAGRIHYELEGVPDAAVLVLSNSLGTTLEMWEPQVWPLARKLRVLRYDTRGHGTSAAPPGPYTLDGLGNDVLELLDAVKIPRAHFCGLSMGGLIGLWLGVHAPERIERLTICDSAARVGTVDAWNSRIAAIRKGGMEAIVPALLERWLTASFRATQPAAADRIRQMVLRANVPGYIACCEALRDADLRERVGKIRSPTLVITGASDPVTPPSDGQFLAEKIPGARYVELPAAHISNIEAAPAFTDALLQFLC